MGSALLGWGFSEKISGSFFKENYTEQERRVIRAKIETAQANDPKPKEEPATLFMDNQASLYRLFNLHDNTRDENLSLNSLIMKPEHHILFKKPFRIQMPDDSNPVLESSRYLLIHKITDEGAIAIDSKGEEQPMTRNFLLDHWSGKVSWVYPLNKLEAFLKEGMRTPGVLEVQKSLNKIAHTVKTTGYYGPLTIREVIKFQREYGLPVDGVVGPETWALLYLMVEKNELHQ